MSLPHLKLLHITAWLMHSILLNHLSIPQGALLILKFDFSGEKSPIPAHPPSTSKTLGNLSQITSIILDCDEGMYLQLEGPNGGLYIYGCWAGAPASRPPVVGNRILHSLHHFPISVTKRLTIIEYGTSPPPEIEKSPVYQTPLLVNATHTLVLTDCLNLPFIFALNPDQTPSNALPLYVPSWRNSSFVSKPGIGSVSTNYWRWRRSGLQGV